MSPPTANYCLMCSQPPKDRGDAWLFDRARKVISLLPQHARALSLTGGEPTLHTDALIGLQDHCKRVAPELPLHLLSNGRRFADLEFARRYAAVGLSGIMAGIPVYAPEPGLHDFIVQAAGAFNETVHGILNLASLGQAAEIRVVVQRHTVPVRPAPVAVRGPLHQRLEERLPGHLPHLLRPRRMRRRLHHKRQPPQPVPAPGTLIDPRDRKRKDLIWQDRSSICHEPAPPRERWLDRTAAL